jgi:hypothetical protein
MLSRAVACLLHKNSVDFRISKRFMSIYLQYFPWGGPLEGHQIFLHRGVNCLNTALPISLSPSLSKILEKITLRRINPILINQT